MVVPLDTARFSSINMQMIDERQRFCAI